MSEHSHSDTVSQAAEPVPEVRLVSQYTDGGHEIDRPPGAQLIVSLVVLAAIVIGSGILVYQLFVSASGDEMAHAASRANPIVVQQDAHDARLLTGWTEVVHTDTTTQKTAVIGYRMPIAQAKALILQNPTVFVAAPAPKGWVHPDDEAPAN